MPLEVRMIFLTGATGYIGGNLALRLLEAGHQVRGLVRQSEAADQLAAMGIQPVLGTLDDAELLMRESAAADAVIHTASADHASSIEALIQGLRGSGKPLLHTSGASVVGDEARGGWLSDTVYDEDDALVVGALKQSRRAIELKVLAAGAASVRSAVICPSLVYGQGRGLKLDSVQIPFLAAQGLQRRTVPVVGAGLNVWSCVHLEDLIELYLLALNQAPAGAFYFAESCEASFLALAQAVAIRLGLEGVVSIAPDEAAKAWGEARAWYSLGSNSRVRARRARRELGWKPLRADVLDWIAHEMPT